MRPAFSASTLRGVDVDAEHVVADLGEHRALDEADVAGAEDRDAHAEIPVPPPSPSPRGPAAAGVYADRDVLKRRARPAGVITRCR